jgi:hypothetical protein
MSCRKLAMIDTSTSPLKVLGMIGAKPHEASAGIGETLRQLRRWPTTFLSCQMLI